MSPEILDALRRSCEVAIEEGMTTHLLNPCLVRDVVVRLRALEAAAAEALAWGEDAVRAGCCDPGTGEPDEEMARHSVRSHVVLARLRQALGKEADRD